MMSDIPSLGSREEQAAREVLGHYDAPAYVRRARQVHGAYDELLARCRQQRQEWLDMVRLRVGLLRALAGDWVALRPFLADDSQVTILRGLHEELAQELRVPVEATSSAHELRRALVELNESLDRFNGRWLKFLDDLDLAPINELRDGYNRYYLLEKECAMRSPTVARHGFRRLDPLTHEELAAVLPLLPKPRLQ